LADYLGLPTYDYNTFGNSLLYHLANFNNPFEVFLHIAIFSALIGSHVTAYLINDRKKLLERTKHSEQQIKQAAQEWKATFDSMPYGVFLTDPDHNIIRGNKYITDHTGLPYPQLISKQKCYEAICKKSGLPDTCPVMETDITNKTETHEYTDNNTGRIISESTTLVIDKNNNITSNIHILTDITNLKNKEKKLINSKNAFFNMLKDLDSAFKELKGVHNDLIIALSNIIDAKSAWTQGHSIDSTRHAVAIAKNMELDHHDIETLRVATLLHDIGKIGTCDTILDKPFSLNSEEQVDMILHPVKGEDMLRPIRGLKKILPIIRAHHERFDGTGYPDGLKGDEIPFLARILCVADSYDAMISNRPYRPLSGRADAISELKRCSGTQFDPGVVQSFLSVTDKRNAAKLPADSP
jgi:putative nucleotidyltransferase with HDIG domain